MDAGLPLLGEAEERRSQSFENLLLLGEPSVIDAARAWQAAVWHLHETLEANFDEGPEGFQQRFQAAGHARDRFYELARRQLQVAGHSSMTGEPQPADSDLTKSRSGDDLKRS